MPLFVYTIGFRMGDVSYEDIEVILNTKLEELQELGAKVVDISSTMGGAFGSGIHMVYLVTYEAEEPIIVDE